MQAPSVDPMVAMIEAFTTVASLARRQWLRTLEQIRALPEAKR